MGLEEQPPASPIETEARTQGQLLALPDVYKNHDAFEKGVVTATPEIARYEREKLAAVAEALDGFNFFLEGGTSVEFHRMQHGEEIYRAHPDIDLGIFEDDREKINQRLREQGWDVFTMPPEQARKTGGHTLEAKNYVGGGQKELVKVSKGETDQPATYIGFHFMRREKDKEGKINRIITEAGIEMPLDWYYDTDRRTPRYRMQLDGHDLFTSAPEALLVFKARTDRPKDVADATALLPYIKREELPRMRELSRNILEAQVRKILAVAYREAQEEAQREGKPLADSLKYRLTNSAFGHVVEKDLGEQQAEELHMDTVKLALEVTTEEEFVQRAPAIYAGLLDKYKQNIDRYLSRLEGNKTERQN